MGSGNFTEGGLFTNYEASLAIKLDLTAQEDTAFLASVEDVLDGWSHEITGRCLRLSEELIATLVASGLVRTEAQIAAAVTPNIPPDLPPADGAGQEPIAQGIGAGDVASPFTHGNVPAAPALPVPAVPVPPAVDEVAEAVEVAPPPAEPAAPPLPTAGLPTMALGGYTSFVMTLQTTDVGVGQKTAGTARRSPEAFIPIGAVDFNPQFWKFPTDFVPDSAWNATHPKRRNGLGKMDRRNVPMRIGVPQEVNIFFNPNKVDLRLRNEVLRSSGNVGDILLITALNPASGQEYDVQVAAKGTPLFQQLQPLCNIPVGHNSLKSFGYF